MMIICSNRRVTFDAEQSQSFTGTSYRWDTNHNFLFSFHLLWVSESFFFFQLNWGSNIINDTHLYTNSLPAYSYFKYVFNHVIIFLNKASNVNWCPLNKQAFYGRQENKILLPTIYLNGVCGMSSNIKLVLNSSSLVH